MKKVISVFLIIALGCSIVACNDTFNCEACGEKVSDDALFCSKCGASLNNQATSNTHESTIESTGPVEQDDGLQYPAENDEWKYDVYTNHIVLTQYKGTAKDVVIPKTLKGLPVTEIKETTGAREDGCFYQNKLIRTVVLTENIKRIGGFEYSSIEQIVFANDEYIEFSDTTFQGCDSIQNVNEIIEHIAGNTITPLFKWSDSSGLSSIVIPDRFTAIESLSFDACSKMKHIDVGNVAAIEGNAFRKVYLESLTIRNKNCDIDICLFGPTYESYVKQRTYIKDLVIYAPAGSTAAQIASYYSVAFNIINK